MHHTNGCKIISTLVFLPRPHPPLFPSPFPFVASYRHIDCRIGNWIRLAFSLSLSHSFLRFFSFSLFLPPFFLLSRFLPLSLSLSSALSFSFTYTRAISHYPLPGGREAVIKTRLITVHYPAKRVMIAARARSLARSLAHNTNGPNYVRNARFSRVSEIAVSCSAGTLFSSRPLARSLASSLASSQLPRIAANRIDYFQGALMRA